jgi:excisionase family DNA binding protein
MMSDNGQGTGSKVELLDAKELAKVFRLPLPSVWRLARDGKLPAFRAGRLLRFDLARVLAALEMEAPPGDEIER